LRVPQFALHETLELHEMVTFKALCLTKSKTMQILVSDPDLKRIMQEDVELTTRQLQELGTLLSTVAQGGGMA